MPPSLPSAPSSSSSSSSVLKPRRHHSSSSPPPCLPCNHPPSAALDLIILVLILSSSAFLVASSFSHILKSLSVVLPPLLPSPSSLRPVFPIAALALAVLLLLAFIFLALEISCPGGGGGGRRRCQNPKCRGLKDAVEFDVKMQTEEGIRAQPDAIWKEIEELPWKGGGKGDNPDYECVRKELRKMAPPNGRAVLLFRARCGCPLSKLEGWGPKRTRRSKK